MSICVSGYPAAMRSAVWTKRSLFDALERVERLDFGKASFAHAMADCGILTRGLLGCERLVQEFLVAPVLFERLACEGLVATSKARHFERPS